MKKSLQRISRSVHLVCIRLKCSESQVALWQLLLCAGLVAAISGCGLKSDPKLPKILMPRAVNDLSVVKTREGAVLKWSLPEGAKGITGFKIFRGEIAADCPACPPRFSLLKGLSLGDELLLKEEGRVFRFIDREVRPEPQYVWRVLSCNARGQCSEASDTGKLK